MLVRVVLLLLVTSALSAQDAPPVPPEVGKPLPAWSRGTLDIHQISTGRGNSAFLRLPDGTTMLVDAGADAGRTEAAEPRPDATRTPGGWIVRYIERAMAPGAPRLDYALITHFHPDHMGQVAPSSADSKSGAFKLTGIAEVGERIPIGTLIDRGTTYLPPPDDAMWKNYRAFVAEQQAHGLKNEPLRVGRADQIVLLHDRAAFPAFEVRNVSGNGVVWTGTGEATQTIFPPLDTLAREDKPTENMCSIGIRIRYGKFDYWTGGDIPGIPDAGSPEWQSVETPIAKAIGPTDVHVVNHHGSISPESPLFLSTLRSQVMILPAWLPTHPSQDVLKRMLTMRLYPGPHDVFVTSLREPTRLSIGFRSDQLKAQHGHIVVRVPPGGATFRVFVLDDMSDEAKVVGVFGPYTAQ